MVDWASGGSGVRVSPVPKPPEISPEFLDLHGAGGLHRPEKGLQQDPSHAFAPTLSLSYTDLLPGMVPP